MTILNIYSARPILPALFAARYLSWEACPHQPVRPPRDDRARRVGSRISDLHKKNPARALKIGRGFVGPPWRMESNAGQQQSY